MNPISMVDLKAQYASLKPEIDSAIKRVFESGQFILGPEVEALEKEFANYIGVSHAVAVGSGTDALELSLRACGIGRNDEVITTAYSFFATAETIVLAGAKPVFVDINPQTYTLDLQQVASRITSKTKAILPVHIFGHACPMDALMEIANRHNLRVIEDCAQATGASFGQKLVGSFGDAGAFSFYPTKNLGGFGEGGMVVTKDLQVAERVRLLRHHGDIGGYQHQMLGRNSRFDEIQAAILRVKLKVLDSWNSARRENAASYARYFEKLSASEEIELPVERSGTYHVYHLYTTRLKDRDRVRKDLVEQGISSGVYYPRIMPSQAALGDACQPQEMFPQALEVSQTCLSLPIHPDLTKEAIERIADAVIASLAAQ